MPPKEYPFAQFSTPLSTIADEIANASRVARAAYPSERLPSGYCVLLNSKDVCDAKATKWLSAYVIQDISRSKEIYVSFKGSTRLWKDFVVTDMQILVIHDMPQIVLNAAQQFMDRVIHDYPDYKIIITGHSLGESIGNLMALKYKIPALGFDALAIRGVQEKHFPGCTDYGFITNISSNPTFINADVEKESGAFYRLRVPVPYYPSTSRFGRWFPDPLASAALGTSYIVQSHKIGNMVKEAEREAIALHDPIHSSILLFGGLEYGFSPESKFSPEDVKPMSAKPEATKTDTSLPLASTPSWSSSMDGHSIRFGKTEDRSIFSFSTNHDGQFKIGITYSGGNFGVGVSVPSSDGQGQTAILIQAVTHPIETYKDVKFGIAELGRFLCPWAETNEKKYEEKYRKVRKLEEQNQKDAEQIDKLAQTFYAQLLNPGSECEATYLQLRSLLQAQNSAKYDQQKERYRELKEKAGDMRFDGRDEVKHYCNVMRDDHGPLHDLFQKYEDLLPQLVAAHLTREYFLAFNQTAEQISEQTKKIDAVLHILSSEPAKLLLADVQTLHALSLTVAASVGEAKHLAGQLLSTDVLSEECKKQLRDNVVSLDKVEGMLKGQTGKASFSELSITGGYLETLVGFMSGFYEQKTSSVAAGLLLEDAYRFLDWHLGSQIADLLVDKAYKAGDKGGAVLLMSRNYQLVLSYDPNNVSALMGMVCCDLEHPDDAKLCDALLMIDRLEQQEVADQKMQRSIGDLKFELAQQLIQQHQLEKAVKLLAQPEDTDAAEKVKYSMTEDQNHYLGGLLSQQKGDFTAAVDEFKKVTGDPKLKEAVDFSLAYCYFRQAKYREAIPYLESVRQVAASSDRFESTRQLIECYYQTGNKEQALALMSATIAECAGGMHRSDDGATLATVENEAELHLRQEQLAELFAWRSAWRIEEKDYVLAAADAEQALKLSATNFRAVQELIICYGQPDSEKSVLELVKQVKINFIGDDEKYGILLWREGVLEESLVVLREACQRLRATSSLDGLNALSSCCVRLNKYDHETILLVETRTAAEDVGPVLKEANQRMTDLMGASARNLQRLQSAEQHLDAKTLGEITADLEKTIRYCAEEVRANRGMEASKGVRQDIFWKRTQHLGVDVVFDALGYFFPKVEIFSPLKESAVDVMMHWTHGMEDEVKRIYASIDDDCVLQNVGDKVKSTVQSVLAKVPKPVASTTQWLEATMSNWQGCYLFARIGESWLRYACAKLDAWYDAKLQELIKDLSHTQSPEGKNDIEDLKDKRIILKKWGKRLGMATEWLSRGLDVCATAQTIIALCSRELPLEITSLSKAVLDLLTRTPVFSRFLLDRLEKDQRVSTNPLRLFFGGLIQNIHSSPLSKYGVIHGETITGLGAMAARWFGVEKSLVARGLALSVPVLNWMQVSLLLYELYETSTHSLPKSLIEREFHNASCRQRLGLSRFGVTPKSTARLVVDKALADTGYYLATAYGEGDCFFDSCAQALNERLRTQKHTVKSLRSLCSKYAQRLDVQRSAGKDSWIYNQLITMTIAGDVDESRYVAHLRYVSDSTDDAVAARRDFVVWGESFLDGRILCAELGVRVHVLEVREDPTQAGEFLIGHQLVDADGSKSLEGIGVDLYQDEKVLHLVVCNNHFVPLTQVKECAEEEQMAAIAAAFRCVKQELTHDDALRKELMRIYILSMYSEHCFSGKLLVEQFAFDEADLFHAVACYTDDNAAQLQVQVDAYIAAPSCALVDVDQYGVKIELDQQQYFGTHEVQALTAILKRPIVVVDARLGPMLPDQIVDGDPIFVGFDSRINNYYGLLVSDELYYQKHYQRALAKQHQKLQETLQQEEVVLQARVKKVAELKMALPEETRVAIQEAKEKLRGMDHENLKKLRVQLLERFPPEILAQFNAVREAARLDVVPLVESVAQPAIAFFGMRRRHPLVKRGEDDVQLPSAVSTAGK